MCPSCCSHAQLFPCPPCTHSPPPPQLYHVGLFTMQPNGILFPGEHVLLDVYIASALRLLAEVQTTGLRGSYHGSASSWKQTPTRLLPRAFAIAPTRTSRVGALAVFDGGPSGVSSTSQFAHFTRFRARVVARYALAAPVHVHAPYACAQIRLLCDVPPPQLGLPLREAFPHTSPAPEARRATARCAVLTRAAAAAVRNARRKRSSAFMAGLSFVHWYACTPERLLRRARAAAMYAPLHLDRCLLDNPPAEGACPSIWSFWLCAALPSDTPSEVLLDLLGECSVIVRLRKLIDLFDKIPRKGRKRARVHAAEDKPYRCKSSPNKAQQQEIVTEEPDPSILKTPPTPQRRSAVRSALSALDDELKNKPWPSSPVKGFQRVNLSTPVKGRFQSLRPSPHDATNAPEIAAKKPAQFGDGPS